MARIELTVDAERDLVEIYLYGLERFGYKSTEKYVDALRGKIAIAAQNPSFGANYDCVKTHLRRYECMSHAIYYRVTVDGILVLRILHGRRDPSRHLT
jgi:toxin ParE1/3/4